MEGAFNRIAVKLAPGTSERDVVARLSAQLARYDGRADQSSHATLEDEIKQQRVLGTLLPTIFLGVAAFLLNVVVSRLVATQREQIAAMKALGYPNRTIGMHYLKLVLVIVALGLVLKVALAVAWAFAPRPVEVELVPVTQGRFETTIDKDGKTRLADQYVVSAPLAGKLAHITLKEGDAVGADMALALLSSVLPARRHERTLRELRARVESAEDNV